MTTLISHPLPILALGLALGPRIIPPRLLLAGLLCSLLPDADMLAFKLGIAYADAFGHRGFSQARQAGHGGSGYVTAHDREPAALARNDLGHEGGAASAAGSGPARVAHVATGARPLLDAGSNLSVGDAVAVANDHRG